MLHKTRRTSAGLVFDKSIDQVKLLKIYQEFYDNVQDGSFSKISRIIASTCKIEQHLILTSLAIVRQLMKDISIPYTVVLIILGISFGAVSRQYEEVRRYVNWSYIVFLKLILSMNSSLCDFLVIRNFFNHRGSP